MSSRRLIWESFPYDRTLVQLVGHVRFVPKADMAYRIKSLS